MTDFKKTIATAKAKVADAETKAFIARLEAIDAILEGAPPHDVMMLAAHALAAVAPLCCEKHEAEFRLWEGDQCPNSATSTSRPR